MTHNTGIPTPRIGESDGQSGTRNEEDHLNPFAKYSSRKLTQFILFWLIFIGIVMSLVSSHEDGAFEWRELGKNLSTELIGAAITFYVLDRVISRRERDETKEEADEVHKRQLIRRLGSSVNHVAVNAAEDLQAIGWLTDGTLDGVYLGGANLEGARLSDASLQGVNLYFARLQRAVLMGANLQGATLTSANLDKAVLTKINLENANLSYAILTTVIHEANLHHANLTNANLREAIIGDSDLRQATLRAAILQESQLFGCNLEGATLVRANMMHATLTLVSLHRAFLREANLNAASLKEADLREADLTEADLRFADLTGANLQGAFPMDAIFNEATILPNGESYRPKDGPEQLAQFTNPNRTDFWRPKPG